MKHKALRLEALDLTDPAEVEKRVLQYLYLINLDEFETTLLQVEEQQTKWVVGEFLTAYGRDPKLVTTKHDSTMSLTEAWELFGLTVTVIVPCHNYGKYLSEAVESVLAQSYRPDEIFLSDDASTDNSAEVMMAYRDRFSSFVRMNINEELMGIERHFNFLVERSNSDLVLFLGADNRIPEDFVSRHVELFVKYKDLSIAYTDFALFGNRAKAVYTALPPAHKGASLGNGIFLSDFPSASSVDIEEYRRGTNFIHGSSMYKKSSWEAVGGYPSRSSEAEDKGLFLKILEAGGVARKVPGTYLEYRQHSNEQANQQFAYFGELMRLRRESQDLRLKLDHSIAVHKELQKELQKIQNSWRFRLGALVAAPVDMIRSILRRESK